MRVLGRRLVFYVITALAAITVDFFIPRMMPGNPVEAILARLQGQITAGTITSLETQFGVGTRQSVMSQYLHYLDNILHGNFGISTGYYPSTVASVIKGALPGDMLRVFNHYKHDEWERFMATTTEWDLRTYLDYLP